MPSSIEFHLIRRTEELVQFVPEWRRLSAQDPNAKPFQCPEWLMPWWRQFGTGELSSIVISRGGEVIGLLPLYVYWDAQRCERQILPIGVGTTDYLDGVFAPECANEDIAHAIGFLAEHVKYRRLCTPQLPFDSRLLAAVRDSANTGFSLSQSEACSRMPAVPMVDLPQKIRRNAMYYRNRAQRNGTLELVLANELNWQEIYAELRRLHTSRWQSQGEHGVLTDERVIAWHLEAVPLLLRAGRLRLAALRLGSETIAVLYSLIDSHRESRSQYFYITAYSPDHADLRPGTLLIAYAIEQAAREGVATIDMLRGDEAYKQIWHMQKVPTWCITEFSFTEEVKRGQIESAA